MSKHSPPGILGGISNAGEETSTFQQTVHDQIPCSAANPEAHLENAEVTGTQAAAPGSRGGDSQLTKISLETSHAAEVLKTAGDALDAAAAIKIETTTLVAKYLQPLTIFNAALAGIASPSPYAQVALGALTGASQLILSQANLDASLEDLLSKVVQTYKFITEDDRLNKDKGVEGALVEIAQVVHECAQFISEYKETSNFYAIVISLSWSVVPLIDLSGKRLGKNIFAETNGKVAKHITRLDELMKQLYHRKAVGGIQHVLDEINLMGIAYADGVGLNKTKRCLDGTRTEVLKEIINWIEDPRADSQRIFWLYGQAGKGKSAIAHTIAHCAKSIGKLGSYFCFTRVRQNEGLQGKLFATAARDLANCDVRLKPLLARVLGSDRSLWCTQDIMEQWKKFILDPLLQLEGTTTGHIVVVIDALDESGGDMSRRHILRTFASAKATDLPAGFRILITSRPLNDIHRVLGVASNIKCKCLDDIPVEHTVHDIELYISSELEELSDVITKKEVKQLAGKSGGLESFPRIVTIK
ncbi:hypothetical protein ID866_8787 [Astraeus odoratus]|nr:hypothetical protein ID866_8787 [Astraeus odoratus]